MRLTRLVTSGFRNLQACDVETDAPFVVFHGPNAHGKTNALGAVYLLCTLKPLRGRRRTELIQWGTSEATVTGWVTALGTSRRYRIDLTSGSRNVELDGKRVGDLNEYFAGIRCICFTPQDARIVAGEPGWRRQWLDRAAFTAAPMHLGVVRTYRRILAQKSAALKGDRPDPLMLDALDLQLSRAGAELVGRRKALLEALEPHVRAIHGGLAGGTSDVRLGYRTDATGASAAERTEALAEKLAKVRDRELRRGVTLAGPQTDEITFTLDGRPARTYGSRGQVRSVVLSLKLAEMRAARDRGEVPLFLIDDLSSELDGGRTERLVRELAELRAQVWVTTTAADQVAGLPAADTMKIVLDEGSMRVEDPI